MLGTGMGNVIFQCLVAAKNPLDDFLKYLHKCYLGNLTLHANFLRATAVPAGTAESAY